MNTYDLIMKRRSVRNFKDEKVPADVIEKLMDAANNAPTGGNMQPLSIIVVQKDKDREKLSQLVGKQPWVKNAPLSMIFCLDYHRLKKWAELSGTVFKGEQALSHFLVSYSDIMIASQNVVILAESFGIGSVYIGTVLSCMKETREYFQIPRYVLPVMVLSMGYPRSIPKNIPKLKREVITHYDRYREMNDEEIYKSFEEKYGNLEINKERYLERAFIELVEAEKQQQDEWVDYIKKEIAKGEIRNNAQFLFNLRYPADAMVSLNNEIIDSFRKAGFPLFNDSSAKHRLYKDLAQYWHIISPPDHYIKESNIVTNLVKKHSKIPAKTLLNLGCGGGHNDMTLKNHFEVAGVDISEDMLKQAKELNPEVKYHQGDMRSASLEEMFDTVTIFDAISYMTNEEELKSAFKTAYNHLKPGGIFYTMNENRPEDLKQNRTETTIRKTDDIDLVFIENYYDPNPDDTTYEGIFLYIIREKGTLKIETDLHTLGTFPDETWIKLLEETGFELVYSEDNKDDRCTEFYCLKP